MSCRRTKGPTWIFCPAEAAQRCLATAISSSRLRVRDGARPRLYPKSSRLLSVHGRIRRVPRRIENACLGESLATQLAGIAAAAGGAVRSRIVAACRQPVVHSELRTFGDDLRFRHLNEWSVKGESLSFDSGLGGQICQRLESRDELGTT